MDHSSSSLRRISLAFVFLTVLGLVVVGCQPSTAKPAVAGTTGDKVGPTYKIGFLAAITGKSSSLGEPERDVAEMFQKQLDAQGGIVGSDGVRHPVKIVIQDTESSSDTAVTLAKKLINDENVVAIIGPTTSGESMALVPVVQEAQVLLISMASSSTIVKPVAERKWVFKVAQSNEHNAPLQVKYVKDKGLTKVANVYSNDSYGEDGAVAIRESAKSAGVQIILEETFNSTDTDMTAQITKIKASGAQAILVTAIPPAAAIFTKQCRELGLTIPLVHNSGIASQDFINLSGAANAEGVVFPMGKLVALEALPENDPQNPVIKQFVADYQAYAKKDPNHFAGHAHDCLQLTLHVLRTFPDGLAVKDQRIRLRDDLEKLQGFAGVDGVFNFSAQDHVGVNTKDMVLVRITNGKWVYMPPEKW